MFRNKMIPEEYKQFCKWRTVQFCPYLMNEQCPETCGYAKDIIGSTKLLENKEEVEYLGEGIFAVKNKDNKI